MKKQNQKSFQEIKMCFSKGIGTELFGFSNTTSISFVQL